MINIIIIYTKFTNTLAVIFSLIRLLSGRYDLMQLVRWAQRKRLPPQRDYYQSLLETAEYRLFRYCVRYPTLTKIVRYLFWTYKHLCPPPQYPKKGSAARYKTRNLIYKSHKTYSRLRTT